jgi:predicted nucleic acid-binding Zn finger protein
MSSESVQPDIEPRTIRAATEYMTVIEEARALFSVTTQSGSEYTVDLREPACTCPDFEYRDSVEECKHIRRVRVEVSQVDVDELTESLTEQVEDLQRRRRSVEAVAQELAKEASEIERAIERLREVTE